MSAFIARFLVLYMVFLPLLADASEPQDNAFEKSDNNRFYESEDPDWENPTIQCDDDNQGQSNISIDGFDLILH